MTYARARLWLGITGVGLMVVLASLALWFDAPGLLQPGQNNSSEVLTLAALVTGYLLIQFPLDFLGGYWLPCRFSRQCQMFSLFFSQYLRGTFLQGALLGLFAYLLLQVGRWGGRGAVMLLLATLLLALVEWQSSLACWIGGLRVVEEDLKLNPDPAAAKVVFLDGYDPGFSGGLAGLPGRERVVLPHAWKRILPQEVIRVEVLRRFAALQSGSRSRGLMVALAWNLGGFYLSSLLPQAGVSSIAELARTILGFTLWSFLGLLVLPTISRMGVFEVDQYARRMGVGKLEFALTVSDLDQLQDDEVKRSVGVETIFHPLPSVENRLAAFSAGSGTMGAWNAARYALYLSWPCVGLLSRAVHCNAGRPELWVMLPVD